MESKVSIHKVYTLIDRELSTAENAALYSDLTVWKVSGFFFEKSQFVGPLYLVLQMLSMGPLQDEDMRNKISRICYTKNYEGNWNLIEQLVRLKTSAPQKILDLIIENIGPHAFFGNWIPLMKFVARKLSQQILFLADRRPVYKKQRKRGYNDKGSLRERSRTISTRLYRERIPFIPIILPPSPFYEELYGRARNSQLHESILRNHTLLEHKLTQEDREMQERQKAINQIHRKERRIEKRKRKKEKKNLISKVNSFGIKSLNITERKRLFEISSLAETLILQKELLELPVE
jgi:hypothetical protein